MRLEEDGYDDGDDVAWEDVEERLDAKGDDDAFSEQPGAETLAFADDEEEEEPVERRVRATVCQGMPMRCMCCGTIGAIIRLRVLSLLGSTGQETIALLL